MARYSGMDFRNRVYLVTGATHGIGAEIALQIDRLGGDVIAIGRSETAAAELRSKSINKRIEFIKTDLSKIDEIKALQTRIEKLPKLNGVVNNASRNSRFSVLDCELEEWNTMLNLNLTAPFLISKSAAKVMISNKEKGRIINIGAVQALSPLNSSIAYSTTKGGLISMSRSLAVDLSKNGILVTTVIPGPILTRGDSSGIGDGSKVVAATLLSRMGKPEEVSSLVCFLLSEENTFMTGNEIIIDGGRLISRKPDPSEITSGVI